MTEDNKTPAAAPAAPKEVDELTVFRSLKRAMDKLPFDGKERAVSYLASQVEAERQARWTAQNEARQGGSIAITGRAFHQ